jgi:hypothetical protein
MEVRCSLYNSLLFYSMAVIFVFSSQPASAQCKADFTFQSFASEKGLPSGKIEVFLTNPSPSTYTFKVFEMNGTMKMVESKESSSPEKVSFERLKPATYFVRVEWGESCSKALGGFEGITITEKDQGR